MTKDLDYVICIKSEDGRVLVRNEDIMKRWGNYFCNLLNGDTVTDKRDSGVEENRHHSNSSQEHLLHTRKIAVIEALRKMNVGRTPGPDEIPIEVWKSLGGHGVAWLTKLFKKILNTKSMSDEWRRSNIVLIFKNKRDIQNYNNYRGRSTIEAIYLLRQLMEVFRAQKKDLHLVFIDLEKAYDRVPKELIWNVLEKRSGVNNYVDIIKDMYEGVVTTDECQEDRW
ncbi:uncharacterized protein LOC122060652 [Macadamia integrifolia]|uniref:uncharacterized protein LOC122060652 n=1 Tax=Macadamia integrifolia TaxID=60698 RepID=UPI001C53016A|nr:uncharacterized protein LOC122060652 [Macadamia integrifolia]